MLDWPEAPRKRRLVWIVPGQIFGKGRPYSFTPVSVKGPRERRAFNCLRALAGQIVRLVVPQVASPVAPAVNEDPG